MFTRSAKFLLVTTLALSLGCASQPASSQPATGPPTGGQGFASPERMARLQIERMLDEQAAAWNRGDLEAFCSVYADDALFLSPSGLTRGRDEVLRRYRARYPDAAARGTLSFEIIEVRLATWVEVPATRTDASVDVRGASLVARWMIDYPDADQEAASGLTLLVLHPQRDGWRIVQDASM
jgi:uncharacterized protein (TIGR02246 family)